MKLRADGAAFCEKFRDCYKNYSLARRCLPRYLAKLDDTIRIHPNSIRLYRWFLRNYREAATFLTYLIVMHLEYRYARIVRKYPDTYELKIKGKMLEAIGRCFAIACLIPALPEKIWKRPTVDSSAAALATHGMSPVVYATESLNAVTDAQRKTNGMESLVLRSDVAALFSNRQCPATIQNFVDPRTIEPKSRKDYCSAENYLRMLLGWCTAFEIARRFDQLFYKYQWIYNKIFAGFSDVQVDFETPNDLIYWCEILATHRIWFIQLLSKVGRVRPRNEDEE